MSTEEQLDSPTATTIRDEVRNTVRELRELTGTEKNFNQFCDTVLARVVKITGAHGALFWQIDHENRPQLTNRSGSNPLPDASEIVSHLNSQHNKAVMDVVAQQQPMGLTSEAFAGSENSSDESTSDSAEPFLMLFTPVFNRTKKCCGALELIQRGDISPPAQEGYLRFLTQISQLFPQWHLQQDDKEKSNVDVTKQASPTQSSGGQAASSIQGLAPNSDVASAVTRQIQTTESRGQMTDAWHDRLEFISEVHRSIDQTETAYSIANETRRLLKCDRVSVGKWNGRKCSIDAISSQDRFDNRANVIRLLSYVATASVSSDSPFWIIGNTDGIAPEVAKKINAYLDEAHSRTLIVIPLLAKLPETPDLEMKSRRKETQRKLGVLVLEYFDADILESNIESDCKLIVDQSELALENARKHGEIFMLPIWKRLGWLQQTLFRDHRSKTFTGLGCLAVLTLFLIFFPKELKMKVEGVMHPSIRKTIFAQTNGIITDVLISDRESVSAGQTLLILENRDLEFELNAKRLELDTVNHRIADAQHQLSNGLLDLNEKRQLGSAIALFNKQIKTYQAQIQLLELKQSHLQIQSPIDGTVLTPQPKRRYTDFPVTTDMGILEVADLDGAWQLELRIPQNKMLYVDEALKQRENDSSMGPLEVEFKISTNPNLNLVGTVTSISRRTTPSQAGPPDIRAIVDIGPDQLRLLRSELRSGAGATAKIKCGTRSLGFVCFYQVWDFMRTKVFF